MKATFRNAEGIKVGNKVTVQGVPFGYVSAIRLIQIDESGTEVQSGEIGIGTRVEITMLLREKSTSMTTMTLSLKMKAS
ncbi:hypothetical protein LEP1GSC170_4722 [Leptospira interrogans serovar Bataviae str. HAI135]|nr:hypothetical protein LEP1GSC170_4722 [Leptospira interrogans serovar Bataviae str. HAI135]